MASIAFRENTKPYIAAISGVKNSGKTTFLEGLIHQLQKQGKKVAVIKHDGHEFQADVPETDTYRLKKAGAYGTAIFSDGQWMVVKEEKIDEQQLMSLFPEADFILLEGMKNSPYPKIEIVRSGISNTCVCQRDTLLAIATDLEFPEDDVLIIALDDYAQCAKLLIQQSNAEK